MHKESGTRKRVVFSVNISGCEHIQTYAWKVLLPKGAKCSIQLMRLGEKSHVALYRSGEIMKLTFKLCYIYFLFQGTLADGLKGQG